MEQKGYCDEKSVSFLLGVIGHVRRCELWVILTSVVSRFIEHIHMHSSI